MELLTALCFVLFAVLKYAVGNEESEHCLTSCPRGEEEKKEEMGNHCYYWSTARKSWKDAEFFCQDKGGHLAAVTSLEIHNFLMKRVDKDDFYTWFWIGGSDKEKEGTWKWTDGSPWSFTHCTMRLPMSIDISEVLKCEHSFHTHFK